MAPSRRFSPEEINTIFENIEHNKGDQSIWAQSKDDAIKLLRPALDRLSQDGKMPWTNKQIKQKISSKANFHHVKTTALFSRGPLACGMRWHALRASENMVRRTALVSRLLLTTFRPGYCWRLPESNCRIAEHGKCYQLQWKALPLSVSTLCE